MMRFNFSIVLVFISCIVFAQNKAASPAPESTDGILRKPYLQQATDHSMVVRWRTSETVKGIVRYGTSPDRLKSKAKNSEAATEQIVTIKGLKPYSKYYYAIETKDKVLRKDTSSYFYTLPKPGTKGMYRVGVFGDCGTNTKSQVIAKDMLLKYLGGNYLNAWILLGDNAYNDGSDAVYQTNFFNVYQNDLLKNYPLFPSPGNHEYLAFVRANPGALRSKDIAYFKNFTVPVKGESGGLPSNNPGFYSYDVGNAHFISLDSYGDNEGLRMYDTLGVQAQWVKKDLEANKNKGWVIAYWHHPPYTMGSHNSDTEIELIRIRKEFLKMLENYNVDMILCGHSHSYERSGLLSGYYGTEPEFNPKSHQLSNSSGMYDGSDNSCPYIKSSESNKGTVYVVSGSAGKLGKKQESFPHDAMQFSDASKVGASILEIQGNRLDLKWLTPDGEVGDQFTMMKDVNKSTVIRAKKGKPLTLTASYSGKYIWSVGQAESKSITFTPVPGRTVYTVRDSSNCIQDTFEILVED